VYDVVSVKGTDFEDGHRQVYCNHFTTLDFVQDYPVSRHQKGKCSYSLLLT